MSGGARAVPMLAFVPTACFLNKIIKNVTVNMNYRLGLIGALYGCLIAAAVFNQAFGESTFIDPRGVEAKTAPDPSQYWQPARALPDVTAPPRVEQLSDKAPLTLPELTEFALRNNPKTRQAWFAARAAAAGVAIEQADLLPQVTANLGVTRALPVSATSGSSSPWITRYGPSVSLSYVLFDFGVQANQVEAAEYRLLAANLTQNRTLQDVVFQVEQAYYRLLGVDALVRVNVLSLNNIKTAYEAAQKRRESGLATVADVYRVETQVAQAQLNLTRSRGEFEKARGQLAAAVGLPVNRTLNVQTLLSPPQIQQIEKSIADLLERAKASRPDLVAAEAQARAARASADAAAKAGLPSLEIAGTAGRTAFQDSRPIVNNYALGLNLRIPLFSGFRDTYSARQAEAQAAQAQAARDTLFQQTELDVWQAYYDLQTAAGGIGSTEAQVKSAEQTAQATLARYKAGFGSILDLTTAQQDESNARVQRVQSYLDWFIALARLNFSIGADNILAAAGDKK
jgi:outer membrane protein TolC